MPHPAGQAVIQIPLNFAMIEISLRQIQGFPSFVNLYPNIPGLIVL